MGEMVYHGEHSINFKVDDEEDIWRNTWENWKLAPSSRPIVNPPEPKKEYVDVPGADGSLDYTEALSQVRYQNRTGSWNFLIDNGHWDWPTLYTEFMMRYQGKRVLVQLTDDMDYYYAGRIEINQFNQAKDYSSFTINYTLEPYKWPIDSYMNRWWKWDELYGTPSYFGPIRVDVMAERNILNPNKEEAVEVHIGNTDNMSIDVFKYRTYRTADPNHPIGHEAYEIIHQRNLEPCERSEDSIFTLGAGEVALLKAYGNGIMYIDCGTGKRL